MTTATSVTAVSPAAPAIMSELPSILYVFFSPFFLNSKQLLARQIDQSGSVDRYGGNRVSVRWPP